MDILIVKPYFATLILRVEGAILVAARFTETDRGELAIEHHGITLGQWAEI